MATESSSLPEQQQPQEAMPSTGTIPSSSWHSSSGSIRPFFAVISVLTVLAVISCVLGRICKRRELTPLESVKHIGCFEWFKTKCGWFMIDKATVAEKESNGSKAHDDV